MKDRIKAVVATDHTFECDTIIIGRAGEEETARLEITLPRTNSFDKVYLDFEKPNGEQFRTQRLMDESGVAVYDVERYIMTESGELKVQLVIETASGGDWRSSVKRFRILDSIKAKTTITPISPSEWSPETNAYNVGDIVTRYGIYYICIKALPIGAVMSTPEGDAESWKRINGTYRGEYSEAEKYNAGDIVEKNGNIYQSNTDNPLTPPDNDMAGHWTLLFESESGGGSGGDSLVTLSGSYMIGGSGYTSNKNYELHPYNFTIKESVNGTVNGSVFAFIEVSGCGGDSCPEQPFTLIKFTDVSGNLVDSFMSYQLENSGVGFTVHSDTRVTALFYSVLTGMMA